MPQRSAASWGDATAQQPVGSWTCAGAWGCGATGNRSGWSYCWRCHSSTTQKKVVQSPRGAGRNKVHCKCGHWVFHDRRAMYCSNCGEAFGLPQDVPEPAASGPAATAWDVDK
eukprot:2138300-Lingulodinium_polyedra.AAC.1